MRADSAAEVAASFIAAINAHDVEAICGLMTEDFVFVDSIGHVVQGRENMRSGWEGYFKWFPDYQISVEDTLEAGGLVAMLGSAKGTLCKRGVMKPENYWQVPAAWKAIVRGGRITEWRVYADNYQTVKMVRGE